MKENFSLKFKFKDLIGIALAVILIVGSLIYVNLSTSNNLSKKTVEIYYQQQRLDSLTVNLDDLTETKTIILTKEEYPDLLGDFKILIDKEKGICVQDITCLNHLCEKQGWVSRTNYPVTCLPNGVFVMITSPADDVIIVG